MNFDIIIGCNLIKEDNLTITPDSVNFSMQQIEMPNKIKTTDTELSITVTDDKPIYHSPRRLPFTERDIVDKQIDEWTQNGIIEPCSSAYASQVLVVRKKDGSP
ncbi:uncharacterized protein K02A2.6-like [Trichonephila clavipes]|nr:uncharacterized protein K02A2.6-like [Trichonephila clavipes]